LTLAFLSDVASWPAARADDSKPEDQPTAVEFELLKSLHIAVQVKINDAGPFRMIFDLGSPVNLVSGKAAVDAGLITKELAKRSAFFGMAASERKAKKFQVGDQTLDDVQVMVMDHPTLKAAAQFLGPIDGIVGYPFFARHKFTIDYPASTITFTPNDYKPQDVMQQMMGRMFGSRPKKVLAAGGLWGMTVDKPDTDHDAGVVITHVWPTSAAADAGLKSGYRVLTIDGRWTDSVTDAVEAASFVRAGETAEVVIRRDDQRSQVVVTPQIGL
jgi:hypothetical protein